MSATALFAAHDELALGALRALAEAGSSMSVVGYDDVPIAEHPGIGLTTVHQPGVAMGARAVELLLERLGGRTEAVHEVFIPDLRVRTTTRPQR
jgi:LacI family transcriptional regulator